MLFQQKGGEGFIYVFKFCIEGTIVELYLLNDRTAFNIVVAVKKLQIKDFYCLPFY